MAWPAILAAAAQLGNTASSAASSFGAFGPMQRTAGYFANNVQPNLLPDPEALFRTYNAGLLGANAAKQMLRQWGVSWSAGAAGTSGPGSSVYELAADLWDRVRQSTFQVPAPGELLTLLNRQTIDLATFHSLLRRQGYVEPDIRRNIESLRYELPGPSDLVSFALREAWDQDAVARFGYDNEFPPEFQYFMERQGYGGDANPQGAGFRQEPGLTWAKIYWRVHWQTLAPTMAYEMFHRLRPSRMHRFQQTIPGAAAFGLRDLQTVLKINDYPEPFRDRLAAIAYRVPRLSDVGRWYELGIIDRAEVQEQHLDMGYDPVSAEQRTRFVVASTAQKRTRAVRGSVKTLALAAYELGTMTRGQAAWLIYSVFVVGRPEEAAWKLKTRPNQESDALGDADIYAWLSDVEAKQAMDKAKELLRVIKKQFYQGFSDVVATGLSLQNAGFTRAAADRYVARWQQGIGGGIRVLSAGKIQKYYRLGFISYQFAASALGNLGYPPRAQALLLQESQRDMALDQAKAAAAVAKGQKEQQRAQEQVVKLAQQAAKQQLAALMKQASPASLKRYFARGVIAAPILRTELIRRGMVEPYLTEFIADAAIDRQLWIEKRQDRAAKLAKAAADAAKQAGKDAAGAGTQGGSGGGKPPSGDKAPPSPAGG